MLTRRKRGTSGFVRIVRAWLESVERQTGVHLVLLDDGVAYTDRQLFGKTRARFDVRLGELLAHAHLEDERDEHRRRKTWWRFARRARRMGIALVDWPR